MTYASAALGGGLIVPRLEHLYLASDLGDIAPASALAYLSAIASGMMAFTAIVFSIAYITVQFNAVAYSPRLALWFADDPRTFHALGLFIATFLAAISTIAWVERGEEGGVPLISSLLVLVLLITSTLQFARLVRGLSEMQISNTLHLIGDRGRAVIDEMYPCADGFEAGSRAALSRLAEAVLLGPPKQTVRYAGVPRTIGGFEIYDLVAQAERAGATIEILCAVGDTLIDDTALFDVFGAAIPVAEQKLLTTIRLGPQRTFEQDPKYPMRLLVDIAIKALSPAINDPTTAVQAIDEIEDILRRLARRELSVGFVTDACGALRLLFPMPSWEDYLHLAFDEIRHYGSDSVQVMRRLRAALDGVAESVVDEERASAVQRYIKHLQMAIDRSALDSDDRLLASQADRQGLGLSRNRQQQPGVVEPQPGQNGKRSGIHALDGISRC